MEIALPAAALVLVPVVIGIVQMLKPAFSEKWLPFLAIFFGILLAALVPALGWREVLLDGVVIGLMSSGLYSGTKTVVS